jgi:hypothetical protein
MLRHRAHLEREHELLRMCVLMLPAAPDPRGRAVVLAVSRLEASRGRNRPQRVAKLARRLESSCPLEEVPGRQEGG